MKYLWTERYRPQNLDDYVFKDEHQRNQVESWVKEGEIPHLLLSGAPGVGKTTLAKILFNELDVDDYDILEINASRENNVDTVRSKINNFSETMPFGNFKVVLLDEADYITPAGQAVLRGVMEAYHSSCRFVLTCNYPNRIIPAIHSRCQGFHIDKVDQDEFTGRIATILIEEEVEMDLDTIDTYVKATYPDLRKCINLVQQNTKDGALMAPRQGEGSVDDYKISMIELFKAGKYRDGRKLVMSQCRQDEAEDLWTWLIDNYKLFGEEGNEDDQEKAILYIRKGMINHPVSMDPILNISATLIELGNI